MNNDFAHINSSTVEQLKSNFTKFTVQELDNLLLHKDFNEILSGRAYHVVDLYSKDGRACPLAIELPQAVPESYLSLILENSQLTDEYLKTHFKENSAFHERVSEYCLAHQRVQQEYFLCQSPEIYMNLLSESQNCRMTAGKYALLSRQKFQWSKLSELSRVDVVKKLSNTIYQLSETDQIKYMQHVKVFYLHLSYVKPGAVDAYHQAMLAQIDDMPANILTGELVTLNFLIKNAGGKIFHFLLKPVEHSEEAEHNTLGTYKLNLLQQIVISGYPIENIELLCRYYPNIVQEPIRQTCGNYHFARDFVDVLMQHHKYSVLQYLPTAPEFARAVAAFECIHQSWALEALMQTSRQTLSELLPLYSQHREKVEPILSKLELEQVVHSKSVGRTLKI